MFKLKARYLALGALVLFVFYELLTSSGTSSLNDFNFKAVSGPSNQLNTALRDKVFAETFELLGSHKPDVAKLSNYKNNIRNKAYFDEDHDYVLTKEVLGDLLQVAPEDVAKLRESHAAVMAGIKKMQYQPSMYSGTGIVMVGGARFFPPVMTALKMIRLVSTLPIEVFFPDEAEYEGAVCQDVLPAMGITCKILKRELGDVVFEKFDANGFPLKPLALLASSFQHAIFMDADSFPMRDPLEIVNSEIYRDNGLILWPDFWLRTTSPVFYEVAGIKLGKRVRGDLTVTDPKKIPMAELEGALPDPSTESGEIFIDKSRHWQYLLLVLYYNLYGDKYYYPLLSQAAHGFGDKEAFGAAQVVLGDKAYIVQEGVLTCGFHNGKTPERFIGTGMLQFDPVDDYAKNVAKTTDKFPRVLFLHANYAKMNARLLFADVNEYCEYLTKSKHRFYNAPEHVHDFERRDIEMDVWNSFYWATCDIANKTQAYMYKDYVETGAENVPSFCEKTLQYIDFLKATAKHT